MRNILKIAGLLAVGVDVGVGTWAGFFSVVDLCRSGTNGSGLPAVISIVALD